MDALFHPGFRSWAVNGLRGDFEAVALVKPGVGREELKRQIEQSLARFNETLVEYELELPDLSTYTERQFFRNDTMSPAVTCIILGLILLIVPAIKCQRTYIFANVPSHG